MDLCRDCIHRESCKWWHTLRGIQDEEIGPAVKVMNCVSREVPDD